MADGGAHEHSKHSAAEGDNHDVESADGADKSETANPLSSGGHDDNDKQRPGSGGSAMEMSATQPPLQGQDEGAQQRLAQSKRRWVAFVIVVCVVAVAAAIAGGVVAARRRPDTFPDDVDTGVRDASHASGSVESNSSSSTASSSRETENVMNVDDVLVTNDTDDTTPEPEEIRIKQFNIYKGMSCADGPEYEVVPPQDIDVDGINGNVSTADVADCRQKCQSMEECLAYTFSNTNSTPVCVLATSCFVRERINGSTITGVDETLDTGLRRYNKYERTSCRAETIAQSNEHASLVDCQAWCTRFDGCRAVTHTPSRNHCALKRHCNTRRMQPGAISAVGRGIDSCSVSPTCETEDPSMVCLDAANETAGEMNDPVPGTFTPPYSGIDFVPTFDKRPEYPQCHFKPPNDPLPVDWVDQCIANARQVGFLRERKGRPNEECPAGWFLCKGMCYTLVQRNNRGPDRTWYYQDDYMFVESRCGLCGGARVAFVGEDPAMQRVAAEAAAQSVSEDKATWVRRYRFLQQPNPSVLDNEPFQPWHLYVELYDDDKQAATYQRYYTGEKDGMDSPGYDRRFRNQEASILCVNTLPRIAQAVKYSDDSNLSMEQGCRGTDKHDMWDNDEHRWRPEKHWPFPGH